MYKAALTVVYLVYLMIKTEDMILISDHNEYLPSVVRLNEFCRQPQFLEGKKNKTQKQSYEKEHNKQLCFHRSGIIFNDMEIFSFNIYSESLFERKNYLKLVAMKAYLYFYGRNSRCVLVYALELILTLCISQFQQCPSPPPGLTPGH